MRVLSFLLVSLFSAVVCAAGNDNDTYDKDSILKEANSFFGETTAGLAGVIEKAFADQGRPNGYIKGEEVSGALGVGLRYGNGS
ncbi:MAG TPA: EipA family protein, partial [Gammaproteobacteria bacterium]|nr:EipA family protein [Gammaproteobacteria bacterium]